MTEKWAVEKGGIPQEFLDWLETNYGWWEVQSWKLSHQWGTGWQQDPVFLYWTQYIRPTGYPTPKGVIPAKAEKEAEFDPYTLQLELSEATTEEELADIWDKYVNLGVITEENAATYEDLFRKSGVGVEPISPLVQRERKIELDEALRSVLDNPRISDEEKALITGDEGKRLQEAYLSGESNEILQVLSRMSKRVEPTAWEKRVGKEQFEAREFWAQPVEFRGPRGAFASEEEEFEYGQMLRKTGKREELERRPPMPTGEKVIKPFLEETGLAKGTRLRQFLTGEFIPEVMGETKSAREAWWKRLHPAGELAGIAQDAYKRAWEASPEYKRLLQFKPTYEEEVGYQRERGMAGAEKAYEKLLSEWQTRAERGRTEWERDPLERALREKKFRPEYFRKPGAGLVRALTPAVRY